MPFSPGFTIQRALLITILVSLLPGLAIIVLTGLEEAWYLEEARRFEVYRDLEAIAGLQRDTTDSIRRTLQTVAALPQFVDGDYEAQAEVIAVLLRENPRLLNAVSTDRDGVVRASPALRAGMDLSDRRHIRRTIETGRFVAGEYVVARVGEEPSLSFAVPVRNREGEISGALGTVYPVARYATLFDELSLIPGARLLIADQRGIELFRTPGSVDTRPPGAALPAELWERLNADADAGVFELSEIGGEPRQVSYRRLYVQGSAEPYLYLVLTVPKLLAGAPARRLLWRNLLLMLATVLFALLVVRLLGHRLLGERFQRLLATAGRIEAGDLTARTGISRDNSELSRIAMSIDAMATRLEQRDRERAEEQQRLARTVAEKSTLLREIHHRVKNNLQMVLSIVHLQQLGDAPPEVFADDLEARIRAMAAVHEMLYESPEISNVEMSAFLDRLVSQVAAFDISPSVRVEAEEVRLPLETAIPVSLITTELLTNSGKYGHLPGTPAEIEIRLYAKEGRLTLEVADHGPGFPPGFCREASPGLGMRILETLAEQLGGTLSIEENGSARTSITFPYSDVPDGDRTPFGEKSFS